VGGARLRHRRREGAYLAARGFAHVQLWHPGLCVSVLTPSRLTGEAFEVFPIAGHRLRADWATVRRALAAEHGLELPSRAQLRAWLAWCGFAEATPAAGAAVAGPPAGDCA
jgi:hypothetical protein